MIDLHSRIDDEKEDDEVDLSDDALPEAEGDELEDDLYDLDGDDADEDDEPDFEPHDDIDRI